MFRFRPYEDGFLLAAGRQPPPSAERDALTSSYPTKNTFTATLTRYRLRRVTKLYRFPALRPTIDFGKGIRILRQEKLEALFSFIISAFNNIKRIQKIIGRICEGLGDELKFNGISYHAFPDIKRLAEAGEEFFRRAGVGYRAKYIAETAEKAFSGFGLEAISGLPRRMPESA